MSVFLEALNRSRASDLKRAGLLMAGLLVAMAGLAQDSGLLLSGPTQPVVAGREAGVWMIRLNPSDQSVIGHFPATLDARGHLGPRSLDVRLALRQPDEAGEVMIRAGGFARREYVFIVPTGQTGLLRLEFPGLGTAPLALNVEPELPDAVKPAGGDLGRTIGELAKEAEPHPSLSWAGQFFKEHIFGYEPFYFIAGPEDPMAKFQISLRYQLVNEEGPLAARTPWLKGISLAYTQTSLWDLDQPSAPFFDTSYKPELLYLLKRVEGGRWADWFRLDLQGGFQHESNGKSDPDSRSLNIVYFRPTVYLGREGDLQLILQPRVWAYVGDLGDNPDIQDYRGYADLRAVVGWARGIQVSAYGRLGEDFDRGSLQLDLTYPLMRLLSGSFSLYLHAQYFTGYGESLLEYNQRSEAARFGLALFR